MTETKKTKKTKQEWLTEAFEPGTRIVCPICSKGVKVTAKGVLARHGHKFVGSGRYGTICVSTGTSTPKDAYGAQRDLLVKVLEQVEKDLAEGWKLQWISPRSRPDSLTRQIAEIDAILK